MPWGMQYTIPTYHVFPEAATISQAFPRSVIRCGAHLGTSHIHTATKTTPASLKLAAICSKTAMTSLMASDCLRAMAVRHPSTTICTWMGSLTSKGGLACCSSCFLHLTAISDNSFRNGKLLKHVPFRLPAAGHGLIQLCVNMPTHRQVTPTLRQVEPTAASNADKGYTSLYQTYIDRLGDA